MAAVQNPFTLALGQFDMRQLRESFDSCNRRTDLDPYDRTTLARWLSGSIPTRGEFVLCMSDKLGGGTLYEAWLEARDAPGGEVKSVITRFRGLSRDQQEDAFSEMRAELEARSREPVRSRFSMRIELHDGADGLYNLRVAANWTGRLPAGARVIVSTSYDELTDAFEQESCLYRDVVDITPEALRTILDRESSIQLLSYARLDGDDTRSVSCTAVPDELGGYRFDNPEVEEARVMLRVSYPFPPGVQIYPILFRNYRVAGPAEITLALRTERAHNPRGYAFLGAGRMWRSNNWSDEVVIEAGAPRSFLGADTGIMLHWSEREASPLNGG